MKAQAAMKRVSVRALCEFAARCGSLEFRYTPAPTPLEGMAGHRTVQSRRPEPYVSEYPLSGTCEGLLVSGRVDGYHANVQEPWLEEIKTYRGKLSRIGPGKRAMHWAQLKVYGALFCRLRECASLTLRLTWFEVRREEEIHEDETFSAEELEQFLVELCRRYADWLEREALHRQQRDLALTGLAFPFSTFREGQRLLSETVYKAAHSGTSLMLQAPTGIGKTLGVLFPVLRAMPEQGIDRVFYLTCRNTGKQLALEGLQRLQGGMPDNSLRVLELQSMEASCDHPESACHGDSCPLANGFFDRLPAARQEALTYSLLDGDTVARIARKHQLCRYFLAQELAHWCDVVVADVNHYFDQHALLFALTQHYGWRAVPVVDEAHNLIDRARAMYSIELSESALLNTIRKPPASLRKPLTDLESAWRELLKPWEAQGAQFPCQLDDVPDALNDALYGLIAAITEYLSDNHRARDIQTVLFTALGFLRLAECFGEHSLCTLDISHRDNLTGSGVLGIDNLIPADHLAERFREAHATILFSATLSPPAYFCDLLGMPPSTVWQDVPSPYSREQIDLRMLTHISTRLDRRDRSLPQLAARITSQTQARPGNYLVFLSSLAYVESLYEWLRERHPALRVRRQHSAMTQAQRQEFIRFVSDDTPGIGLCVLGGVFGEGIDLPGEQLIGVFVATLGLPPNDDKREALKNVLERRYGEGYNYAYLYPAMTKVIQAAGRLIRSPEDRGVIELIDDRYRLPEVRALLPRWWTAEEKVAGGLSGDESAGETGA